MIERHTLDHKIKTDKMFYDITDVVAEFAKDTKAYIGFVIIQSLHTTAGIKIMENEEFLIDDMERYLEKLAPRSEKYDHDDIKRRPVPDNERKNAHSHLKAFFANTTETIPVINGELQLGRWQRIMFVEFDPGRDRIIKLYATS